MCGWGRRRRRRRRGRRRRWRRRGRGWRWWRRRRSQRCVRDVAEPLDAPLLALVELAFTERRALDLVTPRDRRAAQRIAKLSIGRPLDVGRRGLNRKAPSDRRLRPREEGIEH